MWKLPIAAAGNSEMGWENIEWSIAALTTTPKGNCFDFPFSLPTPTYEACRESRGSVHSMCHIYGLLIPTTARGVRCNRDSIFTGEKTEVQRD